MKTHILLVEDDQPLAEMVREFLVEQGFDVTIESDGVRAIDRIARRAYDAVVLDIGLPGTDGFNVCRSVRPKYSGPIIVLTARGEEIDEVIALEVGADDFMAKPVRPRALLARLKVHLRRGDLAPPASMTAVIVGDVRIEASSRTVSVAGERVDLTTAEFELLLYLAQRAGSVVQRKDIYIDLLQLPYDGLDRSIDLRVSRLRRKLNDDPNQPTRIKSIRGVGYLMAKTA
ncbi:response regulator transcription factor [Allorhodopirellula heiligendammensis]|uniref:Transcriptional regulatory protein WalR n=1 Tax=Allorhodopirellula heiligendammensis TaxID=2714739 RepID=A0A5C6BZM5_9BACT|nr:response regulator transcription factor [Allorhodopirellula heiligendammensis]TWU16069.1 Transcriptional regulatory protein WalR [Allorhodopirellula heiligendammensis]